jgi:uncharacterized protein YvpB
MNKKLTSAMIPLVLFLVFLVSACQAEPVEPLVTSEPPAQTPIITSSPTTTPTDTPLPTLPPAATESLIPSSTAPKPTPIYPESHYISSIIGHEQTYELGCEASAAVDWAGFFGVHIFESTFQYALPLSDNPDYGFVGEVTTDAWGQIPPYAYGVHAGPIADALVEFGLPALAMADYSIEEVKQQLSENKPVIAWVIGNIEYSEPVEYIDSEGRIAIVAPYEHVVILTGYNSTHLRYMNNGKFYDTPIDVFQTSWGVLGNMAVIYD